MRRTVAIGLGDESDAFEFDLTETQAQKFRAGRRIGCGSSACAYERPDGRVVKFTQDDNAIDGALRGKRAGCAVVRVDEVYRLPQIVNGERTFVSIEERLSPLGRGSDRARWLSRARDLIGDFAGMPERAVERSRRIPAFRLGNRGRRALHGAMCRDGDGTGACKRFSAEIARLIECMGRQGLAVDDVRVPNVGLDAKGRVKLLDVSHRDVAEMRKVWAARDQSAPLPPWREPGDAWPVLEGGRRRRRRR